MIPRCAAATLCASGAALGAIAVTCLLWCPAVWLPPVALFVDFAGAASVASLILGGTAMRGTRLSAVLGSRPVVAVATYAYALYLVHEPLKLVVYSTLERAHIPFGSLTFSLALPTLTVLAAGVAAWALHHFVERPFLTLKERARETVAAAYA